MANRRSNKRHIHHKQYVTINVDSNEHKLNSKVKEKIQEVVNNKQTNLTEDQENFTINFILSLVLLILYSVILYQHGNMNLFYATTFIDIYLINKVKKWFSVHPFWGNVYYGIIVTAIMAGFNII